MQSQQLNLDVISNNLANVNTTGFKESRPQFQDLLYDTTKAAGAQQGGGNQLPASLQVGQGSVPVATERIFTQGELSQTGGNLDMAIQGNGFFEVQMPDGTLAYTRDGGFKTDSQGRVVTSEGYPVQGGFQPVPPGTTNITITASGAATYTTSSGSTNFQIQLANFNNPGGLDAQGHSALQGNAGLRHAPARHAGRQRLRPAGTGLARAFQCQRRAGNGQPHPRAARVRGEFQGRPGRRRDDANQQQPPTLMKQFPAIKLLILLGLLHGAGSASILIAGESAPLQLNAVAPVSGDGVFLPQLFTSAAPLPAVKLCDSPAFGKILVLTHDQVGELLANNAPAWGTNFTGADSVKISRRAGTFGESDALGLLTETLQRDYIRDKGQLELQLAQPWGSLVLPDEPLTLPTWWSNAPAWASRPAS